MKWILKGLLTPGIHWSEATHFDWETHDKIVLAGGIVRADSPRFGSYAVVSEEYANINFRFGYHFVILDTLCGASPGDNYILFRFSGGGADVGARILRASFIKGILTRLGFTVTVKSDLVDGKLRYATLTAMEKTLEMVGRLLGATKLMDMYIKEKQEIDLLIDEFMDGRYDFRSRK
jgi:pyruvate,water dikinase